jgi:membrane protease YdiL (CAAX protease family)
MIAFLLPVVVAAVLLFAQHLAGVGGITRFPDIVSGQPVTNLLLGILAYTSVVALVPLALLLLARTGQTPSALGIGVPRFLTDWLPGLGLAAAAFGSEIVVLIPLTPLIAHHHSLISSIPVGHVPSYYVVWGLAISAMTAITEEVMMSGYFLTRLEQLGWSQRKSLALSVALRTSYHVYYGLGFMLTIPFGFFVTRSFQKHRRLMRPIAAHFLFDGVLLTIAILQ